MGRLIDISTALRPDMTIWPGSDGVSMRRALSLAEGGQANVTVLTLDVHTGTHVDAPLHTLADGAPVGSIPLERTVGDAVVVAIPGRRRITADDLASAIPAGSQRVLLQTDNSTGPPHPVFDEDFCAITVDAARWLVDHGVRLIGIDAMSIQRFDGQKATHDVLLEAGVVILEGLSLRSVTPGRYRLLCLPLAAPTLEGAPARAVLETYDGRDTTAQDGNQ